MGHWGVKKVCVHKFMNLDLKLINHVHKFIVSNIYNIVDILLCVGKTSKTEQHILFNGQNYKCSFASIWRHCVIVDITEKRSKFIVYLHVQLICVFDFSDFIASGYFFCHILNIK